VHREAPGEELEIAGLEIEFVDALAAPSRMCWMCSWFSALGVRIFGTYSNTPLSSTFWSRTDS